MIAETSRKAYKEIKPFLSGKRKEVYEFLSLYPQGLTRNEIERESEYKFRINAICGRINELMAKGFVVAIGTKKDWVTGHVGEILKAVERVA